MDDWRTANDHYARAARLQPSNWRYAQSAENWRGLMGDSQFTPASLDEAALSMVTSEFGPEARETAIALNNLALPEYKSLARYTEARLVGGRSRSTKRFSARIIPALLQQSRGFLRGQGGCCEAEPLYRRAIEIDEKVLGKDSPTVAIRYNNLALLLWERARCCRGQATIGGNSRSTKGSRQGSSHRCEPLQQSRRIASHPAQGPRPSHRQKGSRKDHPAVAIPLQ